MKARSWKGLKVERFRKQQVDVDPNELSEFQATPKEPRFNTQQTLK
jgi:hypothetical protein